MTEEKKTSYKGSSDSIRKAVRKYQTESVETIAVRVPIGRKDYYKAAAAAAGMSLNQFAIAAMDAMISRNSATE